MSDRDLDLSLLRTFAAIVDEGSLTAAGKKIGRTQPAVTHQLRRLEDLVGCKLIDLRRRQSLLTRDGELLLQYAREMLRINDQARARFSNAGVEGKVIFGTPDLYAQFMLPHVLQSFTATYPKVEIELRSTRSIHLHEALDRGELDVALVSRLPDYKGGQFIQRQSLVWAVGAKSLLEREEILPLALLPPGSISRQLALNVLNKARRPWRIVAVSDGVSGLLAAIYAGVAVAVLPQCAVSSQMRLLGRREHMPALPAVDLMMYQKSNGIAPAALQLMAHILQHLGAGGRKRIARSNRKFVGKRLRGGA